MFEDFARLIIRLTIERKEKEEKEEREKENKKGGEKNAI